MESSGDRNHASLGRRLIRRFRTVTGGKRGDDGGGGQELMARSMGFAAMGFLTLVPLLIVLAAADPTQAAGFARWLSRAISASEEAQPEIRQLFAPPRRALRTTTSFSLAALAVFGVTFAATVQTGYERVWELGPARRDSSYGRVLAGQVLWLCLLIGYLLVFTNTALWRQEVISSPQGTAAALVITVLFLWASQKIALGGRVGWTALLPGACATTAALLGLRLFSRLVFSPLIVANAVAYGPVGAVLVVQSWLVAVGFVVYGGALAGRILYEEARRPRSPG